MTVELDLMCNTADCLNNGAMESLWNGRQIFPEIPELSSAKKTSQISSFFSTIGDGVIDNPALLDQKATLLSQPKQTILFSSPGKKEPWCGIGGINGINTTKKDAVAHAEHLSQFAQGYSIDWLHNRSHGTVLDLCETVLLNLPGTSPKTADLLLKQWTAFHLENIDDPEVKFLQFCHSQGTIHVRNALARAPQEIRSRIIVQAFGPALIIPEDLCYRAGHFACRGDFVPNSQDWLKGFYKGMVGTFESMAASPNIVWVDPHPHTQHPHDFQNPTFDQIKKDVIEEHLKKKGRYGGIDG